MAVAKALWSPSFPVETACSINITPQDASVTHVPTPKQELRAPCGFQCVQSMARAGSSPSTTSSIYIAEPPQSWPTSLSEVINVVMRYGAQSPASVLSQIASASPSNRWVLPHAHPLTSTSRSPNGAFLGIPNAVSWANSPRTGSHFMGKSSCLISKNVQTW